MTGGKKKKREKERDPSKDPSWVAFWHIRGSLQKWVMGGKEESVKQLVGKG